MSLNGMVALVTGGAQGIGRAVVHSLMQSSVKVAILDMNQSCGEKCKEELDLEFGEGNCTFTVCDVSNGDALRAGGAVPWTALAWVPRGLCALVWSVLSVQVGVVSVAVPPVVMDRGLARPDAFQRTVDTFGQLDIVINNAGINNEKNWGKTIEVNLTSVIRGTYLALEHMSREHGKGGGIIINVSSMAAFFHSPHQPVYTATKHGVIGFTRAMADASAEGNYGVRINVVCPAFVNTALLRSVEREDNMGKFVKFKDDFKSRMDKFGILEPSLIAEGMIRLIKDTSLNGAVMKITSSKGIHFHTYEPMSA
ncbi:15-hydroxyprostaglandin dehydrogenase [NAD(+)] [Takifugu flavidus]|uniref:15-hydroxyprostaglandin dehydrogenase [NAD(+)] n=1 Tax=Takifugu flavidus TaxID=433684 RepID=A0A5C6MW48_9TELE|nr:15-hydroxyprostaglandin dehydrogenase [NAD(+)] [Takifugu flavidus]